MPNPTREDVEAEIAAFMAAESAAQPQPATEPAQGIQTPDQSPDRQETTEAPSVDVAPVEPITPDMPEQEPQEASTETDRDADPEYWKQRFKTVEGMQKKQQELNEQQQAQNAQLIELLQKQQQAPVQREPEPPAPVLPMSPAEITDEMVINAYGEEAVSDFGMEWLKRDMAKDNRLATLSKQVDTLVQTTHTRDESAEKEREERLFWDLVSQQVPDAERMNRLDPDWHEWLEVEDPTFGVTRKEMLQAAYNRGDATAVARAMAACKNGSSAKPPTVPSLPTVSEQAQPDTSVRPPAAPSSKAKTYKQSQVNQYYEDRARGRLSERYSQEQILQMENQITNAVLEGRVLPG